VMIREDMSLADELLARRRMLRRIDVAEARAEGANTFVAVEDVESEDLKAGVTRVSHDCEVLRTHPWAFEVAADHPAQRPLHDPLPTEYTDEFLKGRQNGHAA
jgi:hypothetical protein